MDGHIVDEPLLIADLEHEVLPNGSSDSATGLPCGLVNLLVVDKKNNSTPQFYVDVHSKRVMGFPEINTASKRLTMLTLAELVGNESTIEILEDVMKSTLCFRTKVGAASAIGNLLPASQRDPFKGTLAFDPEHLNVSVGEGLGRDENYIRITR